MVLIDPVIFQANNVDAVKVNHGLELDPVHVQDHQDINLHHHHHLKSQDNDQDQSRHQDVTKRNLNTRITFFYHHWFVCFL
jgi:hypothetical protein